MILGVILNAIANKTVIFFQVSLFLRFLFIIVSRYLEPKNKLLNYFLLFVRSGH